MELNLGLYVTPHLRSKRPDNQILLLINWNTLFFFSSLPTQTCQPHHLILVPHQLLAFHSLLKLPCGKHKLHVHLEQNWKAWMAFVHKLTRTMIRNTPQDSQAYLPRCLMRDAHSHTSPIWARGNTPAVIRFSWAVFSQFGATHSCAPNCLQVGHKSVRFIY